MWSVHMFQPQWSRDHLWECFSANTRRWTNAGLMLGHRLRRWPNINTTLVRRLVFAGFFFPFISSNLSSQTCERGALVPITGRQFDPLSAWYWVIIADVVPTSLLLSSLCLLHRISYITSAEWRPFYFWSSWIHEDSRVIYRTFCSQKYWFKSLKPPTPPPTPLLPSAIWVYSPLWQILPSISKGKISSHVTDKSAATTFELEQNLGVCSSNCIQYWFTSLLRYGSYRWTFYMRNMCFSF